MSHTSPPRPILSNRATTGDRNGALRLSCRCGRASLCVNKAPVHGVAAVRLARIVGERPLNADRPARKHHIDRGVACPGILAGAGPAGSRRDGLGRDAVEHGSEKPTPQNGPLPLSAIPLVLHFTTESRPASADHGTNEPTRQNRMWKGHGCCDRQPALLKQA